MQIRNLILNLLLLALRISHDLSQDAGYKGGRFSKNLREKVLEFLPSKRDSTIAFKLGLILLLTKVDPIPEKQCRKKDAFSAYTTSRVEKFLICQEKW